jgi:hypothetical protein
MRVIIDARRKEGLPDAVGYYRTFPREPSPAGDITIERNKIVALNPITLELLLDQLTIALDTKEREVMVVCHAFGEERDPARQRLLLGGLNIPLERGSHEVAEAGHLKRIQELGPIIARGDHVAQMPQQTQNQVDQKLAAWRDFFIQDHVADVRPGDAFTLAEAKKQYDEFLQGQLTNVLRLKSQSTLRTLITKGNQVRAHGFDRIEFRACDLGTANNDRDETMKIVARFFGAKRVLAPRTETFFLRPAELVKVQDAFYFFEFLNTGTGPFNPSSRIPTRNFERLRTSLSAERTFSAPLGFNIVAGFRLQITPDVRFSFALRIWEPVRFHFRAVFGSPGRRNAEMFLNLCVMPGARFTGLSFPLAGFWNVHTHADARPFVLPNENGYRDLISEAKV